MKVYFVGQTNDLKHAMAYSTLEKAEAEVKRRIDYYIALLRKRADLLESGDPVLSRAFKVDLPEVDITEVEIRE
jgi:hypothetical protein